MTAPIDLTGQSLTEALAALQLRVRKAPGDGSLRNFLFQLLAVMGQWDRALTQLGVAGELDAGAIAMVQTYRDAVQAEALRADVFAGRRAPVVFGEPAPWVALMLEALKLSGEGHHAKAAELRAKALEDAPATPGHIVTAAHAPAGDAPPAGDAFEWLADADSRLGPMFEATVQGRYWWIPTGRVKRLHIEAPADLRDLVWTPVHFEWANGGEAWGMMPTRYPGSEGVEDDLLKLARRTDWTEVAEGTFHGAGQRMFATDAGEYPLLEIRSVEFDLPASDA